MLHRMLHAVTGGGRLGLRARITLAFALGSLLLSALMAGSTFGVAREQLIRQRESAAVQSFFTNAGNVSAQTRTNDPDDIVAQDLLASLGSVGSVRPVFFFEGEWFSSVSGFGEDALPQALRDRVAAGETVTMRYSYRGEPTLAVGVPLPEANASYFEIVSLDELSDTLRSLGIILLGGALATAAAGAGLGYSASRRALMPLTDVSDAAHSIAGGRLETRLEIPDDPDLTPLTSSFNEMAAALEERIERDARFASDVSHELRSPLMTLSASMEVLKTRRDAFDDRARSAFDLLDADVNRFQHLVDDLLEISRFDSGSHFLDPDLVEATEVTLHAVGAWGGAVPVSYDPAAEGALIYADKRRIERVIANLLDNARHYGDGATRVLVEAQPTTVRIIVEDEGPGVPEDQRTLIFDRFSRGAEAGRRSGDRGVGLGLALVAEHVALHGGSVWVEDRPDGQDGARFVLELPREVQ
jgi:two-component system sensor histidine kinase MtrB